MADECMVQSKTNADDAPCPQPQPQKTSLVSQIPLPSDTHSVLQTPIPLAEKYQYIQKLGQGSQAKVFLAQRLSDKKNVAIKQLDIASVSNWKSYDLFQREAAVLASLHVDGVARFYEAIECLDDAHPCSYLVQEYIEGKSLGDMLKSGHRFSIDEVYDILIQMLTILNQLHSRPHPVIHRDIKPSNIMLTPTDDGYRVTLIDFGAVANPQVQRGGSTVAGTYGYMSPEQMMGHPQPASDIYSLAAVAVELFTGVSPASMPVKDFHLIFEPQMQSHPHMLVETLRKMLDPDIAKRECNCLGLIETFKQYKNGNFERKDDIVAMDSKYDTKLSEVSNMGASGNIALWQALPDQTPRNVPQAYRFANWSEIKAAFGFIDTLSYKNYYTVSALAGIVCAILVVLGIVENAGAFSVISLTIAALLFCLMVASFIGARKRFKNLSETKQSVGIPHVVSDLLQNGTKTIATITNIEYVPVTDSITENKLILACENPCFKISYKFNPIEDFRSEDLIHTCYVYNEPEKTYRVGDPIPILYKVEGENFDEIVRSMPYPYPLRYISEKRIVCESSPGDAYWTYAKYFHRKRRSYKFVEFRNDPEMLGAAIDRISSYKGLSDNDIQLRLLPLLNCYLQSDRYTKVHRVCIKYMLWRLNEATSLKTQVNVYIQNYIRSMCASKELKSPDAFSMLLREVNNNPHFFSDDTIRLILGVLEFDNTRSLIPADPFPATLYNKILSMPNLRHLHKDIYKEVLLKTGIKHDDIHELLSSDEQPKQ